MIISITAKFACDGCGTTFTADMDPGLEVNNLDWSIMDYAEDAIRADSFTCTIQGGHHLCRACTQHVDETTPDSPTYEQVSQALKYLPRATDTK